MESEAASNQFDLDCKVVKRHYPRVNNDSVLEFIFEKDPNLFLRTNKIIIKGKILIDQYELKLI